MSNTVAFREAKTFLTPRMAERNGGFWCPDGWLPLVLELDTQLCRINPDYRIVEVKERLGQLRFGIEQWDDEMKQLIKQAELASLTICQNCGAPDAGSVDMGCVATLCDTCTVSEDYHRRGY